MMPILIAARPGAIQEVLSAMLASIPGFTIIAITNDGPSALEQFRRHTPAIIVADGNLSNIKQLIVQVKSERPQTQILFIANTTEQEFLLREWGADTVLKRGISTRRLRHGVMALAAALETTASPQKGTLDESH